MNCPFYHNIFSLFISWDCFDLESILFGIIVTIPALFWLTFIWNIFSYPFIFSLHEFLKWISYTQHIPGSLKKNSFSYSVSLIRESKPFTFKATTDKKGLTIAVLFVVFCLSHTVLSLFLSLAIFFCVFLLFCRNIIWFFYHYLCVSSIGIFLWLLWDIHKTSYNSWFLY